MRRSAREQTKPEQALLDGGSDGTIAQLVHRIACIPCWSPASKSQMPRATKSRGEGRVALRGARRSGCPQCRALLGYGGRNSMGFCAKLRFPFLGAAFASQLLSVPAAATAQAGLTDLVLGDLMVGSLP